MYQVYCQIQSMIGITIDKTVRSGRHPTLHIITHSHPEHTVTRSLAYSMPNTSHRFRFPHTNTPPYTLTQHSFTHTLIYYTYQLPHSRRHTHSHTQMLNTLIPSLSLLLTRYEPWISFTDFINRLCKIKSAWAVEDVRSVQYLS